MSLKQKIFFPMLSALVVLGLLGYLLIYTELGQLKNEVYQKSVQQKSDEVQAAIAFASHQALQKAAMFTHWPVVLEAFKLAHQGDISDPHDTKAQLAREQLRQHLHPVMEGYSQQLEGDLLRLHFHLPNGRSLVRMWREKQVKRDGHWQDMSDDISSFRQTVLEVNNSGKPVQGIELGRGGFVLRGLAPIRDEEGQVLGSVEVLMDLQPILNSAVQHADLQVNHSLFLFMNAEHLSITTRLNNPEQYPVLDDKYVYVYGTGQRQGKNLLTSDLLDQGRDQLHVIQKNNFAFGLFPIQDFSQRYIGVMAYTFDITQEEAHLQNVSLTLIGILFAILLALGLLGFMITNKLILKPIKKIIEFSNQVRQGDNDVVLDLLLNDEIGRMADAINHMVAVQRQVLHQIHRTGVQVTSSATELAATAKQQKATILTQLDSTHKVAVAVESITSLSDELVQTMEDVAAMSAETADFAAHGQSDLSRMQIVTQHMEEASTSISSRLEAINEKTENISSVVTTITKVAEQTNLLSLNAAIEAEKAGEYGHGFNVVAREIRRLADQTAVATLDIERMMKEMQSAVSAGVMEMDKFIEGVRHSAEDVGKLSLQLNRIIEQVRVLSPNFYNVKQAMIEQSSQAKDINVEMIELGEGMQQTSDSLQESFLAIEQLNEAARGLQTEVERFR